MIPLRVILGAIALLAMGWLYLSPPVIEVQPGAIAVNCRPLGPGNAGQVYIFEPDSYGEQADALRDAIAGERDLSHDPNTAFQASASLTAGCEQARTNRQTSLFLLVGLTLAALIIIRPRVRESAIAQDQAGHIHPIGESNNG